MDQVSLIPILLFVAASLRPVLSCGAARARSTARRAVAEALVAVSPGVGFGEYGDGHVRIALIENEHRLRQALRGVREMFRKDGLLKGAA